MDYVLAHSLERKDAPGAAWRLFDYDQTHVATAVASYELPLGFEVGARLRYATGFPRTPVIGAYYNSPARSLRAGRSARRARFAFLRSRRRTCASASSSRGKGRLELYADVQNITNRSNREDIVYNFDYTQKSYITGLPTLAVVGARLEW